MGARELLESLFKIGTIVQEAQHDTGTQTFDFGRFLSSDDFKTLRTQVETAIDGLKESEFTTAISEIKIKQDSLRAGRALSAMSTGELAQYSQLANTRLMLASKDVAVGHAPDFLKWIMDDALPVLARVIGIVIPLLV